MSGVAGMHGHTIAERFWAKVDRSGGPDACWPWRGAKNSRGRWGYGVFYVGQKRLVVAHRVALEWSSGPPPSAEHDACHHCDNPPCCNPEHLFWGTPKDNTEDARSKGRLSTGAAHAARLNPLRGDAHPYRRHPELIRRGDRSGTSKLAERDIPVIRALLRAGVPQREVAGQFGVSQPTVAGIKAGKRWGWLSDQGVSS